MATFQKNFVVKNGLEIGLLGGSIFHASAGGVGVGSTLPVRDFDVTGSVGISEDLYVQGTSYNNNFNVSGFSTFSSVQVQGNLEVLGIQLIVNTEEVRIEDKNITLGFSTQVAPSDFYSSGGGIEIAGDTATAILTGIGTNENYKSFVWYNKPDALFVSNQRVGIGTSTATNGAYLDVGGTVQFKTNQNWDFRVNGRSKLTGFTEIDNLSFSGIASLSQISVGSSLGDAFQYIRKDSTNAQLEWASFPALRTVQSFTATAGQTLFTPSQSYNIGFIDVYVNGVRLNSSEFAATNGTNIVLAVESFAGDIVDLIIYAPDAGGVTSTVLLEELNWKQSQVVGGIYTSGAVSIGTSASSGTLTVDGTTRFSGSVSIGTFASFPTTDLLVNDPAGYPNIWLTAGPDVSGADFRIGLTLADDNHAYLSTNDNIDLNFAVGGGVTSHVVIKEDGKVGIGSTLPTEKVDVGGTIKATSFVGDGSGLTGVIAASGGINLRDHDSNVGLAATVNIGGNLAVTSVSAGVATIFYNSEWIVSTSGIHTLSNVGIGTTNPTSKLTVDGNARITGILTVGSSSITLNGDTNRINVGAGVTIDGVTGIISATEIYANGIPLGGAKVTISETAPSSPIEGNLWYSSLAGRGFIWYNDGDSSQWVDFSPTPGDYDLLWTQSGDDKAYSNFKVGIGSTLPTSALDVIGDAKFTGIVTASSFVPSSGFIKAPDGTNSLYLYSGTGNVAFQGTIGASQINNASGYKVIGFAGTDISFENNATISNNLYVSGVTTSNGGFVGNLTGNASTSDYATYASNAGVSTYAGTSGISTVSQGLTGNPSISVGIVTASSLVVLNTSRFTGTVFFEGTVYEPVANDFTTNITITSGVFDIDASQSNTVVGVATTTITKWNFINVDSSNSKSITITLILDSDVSNSYADACDVNGSAISGGVLWSGGLAPIASNNTDILTFSVIRDSSGTVRVYGFGSSNFN